MYTQSDVPKINAPSDPMCTVPNDDAREHCGIPVPFEKNNYKDIENAATGYSSFQTSSDPHHVEERNDDPILSNNSSPIACHTSAVESQHSSLAGSPLMKEAMSMLRGVWYQSGLDDGHVTEEFTKIKDIHDQENKFTIYQDVTQTVPFEKIACPENVGNSDNCSHVNKVPNNDDEDLQNKPPEGYIQEKIDRPISGILQPSIGIPSDDQAQPSEEEEDDDADAYRKFDTITRNFDNITVSAEKFAPSSHLVSTPFQGAVYSAHDDTIPSEIVSINEQQYIEKHPILSTNGKTGCESYGLCLRAGNDLSVIAEGSCENYSKSSSSKSTTQLELSSNHLQQSSSSTVAISAKHSVARKPFYDVSTISVIAEGRCENYSKSSSSSSFNATTQLELSSNHLQHSSSSSSGISAKHSVSRKPFCDISTIRNPEVESVTHTAEPQVPVLPTDIDPFDTQVTQNILSRLSTPLSERSGYNKVNEIMPVLRIPRMYQLGKEKYVLLRCHAQGSYAKIYVAQHSAKGKKDCTFALKVSKPFNEWEFYICSELWERLNELNACPDVRDSIIFIENAVFFKDGVILVSKFGGYGTLIDIGNLYKKRSQTMPECLVMCFALEMLHVVQQIHRCKIIHADVKPDNFLVINLDAFADSHVGYGQKTGVLELIDFGRSIDMTQYPSGTAFKTVVNTSSFKCTEMLDGRDWTYQTDWFGVVGTIHTLLFAEYMKVKKNKEGYWEICNKLKRYWHTDLWMNLFHTLLNIPGCDRIPDISPFITELDKMIQEHSMATEIKRKAMQLYDMWSENTK